MLRRGVGLVIAPALAGCVPRPSAPEWRGLVKLGLVLSFHGADPSGALAAHGTVRDALIARNAVGGVRGYRLELVSLDDFADPAVGQLRAAELAIDPHVLAAVHGPSTSIGEAMAAFAVGSPDEARAAAERFLAALDAAAAAGRPDRTSVRRALAA